MRTSLAPDNSFKAASTSAMTGAQAIAAAVRSLPCRLSHSISALNSPGTSARPIPPCPPANLAKTSRVANGTPGLTSTVGSAGKSSGTDNTSPTPRMTRGRGSRHTGTSAPTARAAAIKRGSSNVTALARAMSRQGRCGIGRTAAETGRRGKVLLEQKAPGLQSGDALPQRTERLENQIVGHRPALAGERSSNFKSILGIWLQCQHIADIGEGHQAFKLMIAIDAAADHPQCQIDFGGSFFEQRRAHAMTRRLRMTPLAAVAALLAGLGLR